MKSEPLLGVIEQEHFQIECVEHSRFSLSELINCAFKQVHVAMLSSDSTLIEDWIDQQLKISLCFILNDAELSSDEVCTVEVNSGAKLVVLDHESGKTLLTRTIQYGFFTDLLLKQEEALYLHGRLCWLARNNEGKISKTKLHQYDVIGSSIINDGNFVVSDVSLLVGNEVLSIKARGSFGPGEAVYLSENNLSGLKSMC